MKTCSRCKVEKEFSAFGKNINAPLGLHYSCKECRAEIAKTARKKNPEKYNSYSTKYYYCPNASFVLSTV